MARHLLVVDDEPLTALLTTQALAPLRFRPLIAATVEEARRAIQAAAFDLAVLDVALPDGSGFDLCQELRGVAPSLVILFASGYDDRVERQRAQALGADAYLVKPYTALALLTCARNALLRHGWRPAGRQRDPEQAPEDRHPLPRG